MNTGDFGGNTTTQIRKHLKLQIAFKTHPSSRRNVPMETILSVQYLVWPQNNAIYATNLMAFNFH